MGALQQADNAISVTDSSMLRCSDDNGLIGTGNRIFEALLNTRRTVDYNIFILFF
ncbi:hypothetical protein D3C80_1780820 [compost metagenome]